jgi:hypothetical protein
MSDFSLPLRLTLITGMSGSGKSHLAYRYLYAAPGIACRFIYDDLDRASTHYGVRPCQTADELEAALETRWVVFRPHKMFPDDFTEGFAFFCKFVLEAAGRGPGRKLFLVDEVWQYCTPQMLPREFSRVLNLGRVENLEVVTATMWPHKLHSGIIGGCTEAIFFRTDERLALEAISGIGGNPDEIRNLPPFKFVAYNRLTRSVLHGKVR